MQKAKKIGFIGAGLMALGASYIGAQNTDYSNPELSKPIQPTETITQYVNPQNRYDNLNENSLIKPKLTEQDNVRIAEIKANEEAKLIELNAAKEAEKINNEENWFANLFKPKTSEAYPVTTTSASSTANSNSAITIIAQGNAGLESELRVGGNIGFRYDLDETLGGGIVLGANAYPGETSIGITGTPSARTGKYGYSKTTTTNRYSLEGMIEGKVYPIIIGLGLAYDSLTNEKFTSIKDSTGADILDTITEEKSSPTGEVIGKGYIGLEFSNKEGIGIRFGAGADTKGKFSGFLGFVYKIFTGKKAEAKEQSANKTSAQAPELNSPTATK